MRLVSAAIEAGWVALGRVVKKASEFSFDAVWRKPIAVPGAIEKGFDAAGQHRDGAAGMREQPLDIARTRERAADEKTHNRAGRIVRYFNHRGERADIEPA